MSEEVSRDLLEEILLHRQLRAAENGDLTIDIQLINAIELLKSAVGKIEDIYCSWESIVIADYSSNAFVDTDNYFFKECLLICSKMPWRLPKKWNRSCRYHKL